MEPSGREPLGPAYLPRRGSLGRHHCQQVHCDGPKVALGRARHHRVRADDIAKATDIMRTSHGLWDGNPQYGLYRFVSCYHCQRHSGGQESGSTKAGE